MDKVKLERGIVYLEELGYRVKVGESVYKRRGYLAGTDEERAEDLKRMFLDPDVKAVFCARGGYGSSRMLDKVDYDVVQENPKILVGYSDVTALQMAIFAKTGLVTFSGPMVALEMGGGMDGLTEEKFWRSISSPEPMGGVENPEGEDLCVYTEGTAEGEVVGGNLSLICSLLGTEYIPVLTDKILYLEEVGEAPYRVDRCLNQLRLAGVFRQVSGLVLGRFVECVPVDSHKPSFTVEEVLDAYGKGLGIPVMGGLAYGHVARKVTLPVGGVRALMDSGSRRFELLEGGVL